MASHRSKGHQKSPPNLHPNKGFSYTQPTYDGLGRQGTHCKEDSIAQVKLKPSRLFLLKGLNPFIRPYKEEFLKIVELVDREMRIEKTETL